MQLQIMMVMTFDVDGLVEIQVNVVEFVNPFQVHIWMRLAIYYIF